MKLFVKISPRHRGKVLEVEDETETMTLGGAAGEKLGTASWDAVIDFIQGFGKETKPHQTSRKFPRSRLAAKVSYLASDRKHADGITCEIGGGGIFIETRQPHAIGTSIELELVLPDNHTEPIKAQGKVAWIRAREEHYAFPPGMGIQFTEISENGRVRLLNMVKTLDQARQGK